MEALIAYYCRNLQGKKVQKRHCNDISDITGMKCIGLPIKVLSYKDINEKF